MKQSGVCWELRSYTMLPGRMAGFHELMSGDLIEIMEKYEVPRPFVWESYCAGNVLLYCYLIKWRNMSERFAAWDKFAEDPSWNKQVSENYAGIERVQSSDVCVIKQNYEFDEFAHGTQVERSRVHEILSLDAIGVSPRPALNYLLGELPYLLDAGAEILGVYEARIGVPLGRVIAFLGWPNEAASLEFQGESTGRGGNGTSPIKARSSQILYPMEYGAHYSTMKPAKKTA